MIDKSHIKLFKDIQRYKVSETDIKNLISNIEQYIPIFNILAQQRYISNAEDLKNYISYFATLLYETYTQNNSIGSLLYEHQAIENLIKHPQLIQQLYPKIKDTPNTHTIYTANLTLSTKRALINALDEVSTLENYAKESNITPNTSIDSFANKDEPDFKKRYTMFMNLLKAKTLHEKLLIKLKEHLQLNEENLKKYLIESLSVFHDFFNTLAITPSYLSSYSYNSRKFGFDDLQYDMSTGSFLKDSLGLDESFSPEFLQTLDIYELCFLNIHWCNRFAKESTKFLNAQCAINSLNLWENIFNGETSFKISDEAFPNILRKITFLSTLLSESFWKCQNEVLSQEAKLGNKFSGDLTRDFSSYYEQLNNYIGNEYRDFFSNNLDGIHNLLEDAALLTPFVNLEQLTYRNKNLILEPLIKYCLDNPQCIKNWGLVRYELINGELVDTIAAKKAKVLIGFDIEGFSHPFFFHENVNDLMDLIKLSNENFIIQEYQGHEDFIINSEFVPANIIMPIPKRHEQLIIEKANTPDENQNFWEHKLFLMNQGKFPKHLSETIVTNKKRTVQARLPIYYTDLKTGERYCKIDKKLRKLEDDGRDDK